MIQQNNNKTETHSIDAKKTFKFSSGEWRIVNLIRITFIIITQCNIVYTIGVSNASFTQIYIIETIKSKIKNSDV